MVQRWKVSSALPPSAQEYLTMGLYAKRKWPVKKVVERYMDFHEPGALVDTLECGHVIRDELQTPYRAGERRRCGECYKQKRVNKDADIEK